MGGGDTGVTGVETARGLRRPLPLLYVINNPGCANEKVYALANLVSHRDTSLSSQVLQCAKLGHG